MRFRKFLEGWHEDSDERFLAKWMTNGFGFPEKHEVEFTKENILRGVLNMFKRAVIADSGGMKNITQDMIDCARKLGYDYPEFKTIEQQLDL